MTHVLVVEDDLATRLLFAAMLRRHDVRCTSVADGGGALEALKRDRYDAVLLDLVMPGMSGFDVLREIERTQPDLKRRVVVCSALSARELRNRADLESVAMLFPKPPDIEELTAAVLTAASRSVA